jgi:hypothetical protein
MIITGTGFIAAFGVTSVICMSTVIDGNDELSTWPVSCRPMTGRDPSDHSSDAVADHVTLGTLRGIRPMTSRSKSSTISGRRCVFQTRADVTFVPFASVSASGRIG